MIALIAALSISLPIFGGGPATNVQCAPWKDRDCDAAWTNASAHVAWSLAVPLVGERIGGRRGLWIAGGAWIAATLVQEAFFHPGDGPEERTDLLTRLVPCVVLLAFDLVRR